MFDIMYTSSYFAQIHTLLELGISAHRGLQSTEFAAVSGASNCFFTSCTCFLSVEVLPKEHEKAPAQAF